MNHKKRASARLFPLLCLSLDLTAVVVSFYTASFVRDSLFSNLGISNLGGVNIVDNVNILVIALPFFAFSLYNVGIYDKFGVLTLFEDLQLTVKGLLSAFLVVVLMIFTLKYVYISRTFIAVFGVLSLVLVAAERTALYLAAQWLLEDSVKQANVLVVGSGQRAVEFIKSLGRLEAPSFRLCGVLTDDEEETTSQFELPIVGKVGDLPGMMEDGVVDAVVFAVPYSGICRIRDAFAHCLEVGVPPYIFARPFEEFPGQVQLRYIADTPMVGFPMAQQEAHDAFTKRLFDICFSFTILVLFAPIGLWIALKIKFGSEGPIIFKQRRVGKNGRVFNLYKFRTMFADAEQRRADLMAKNEMDGPVFKMRDDPRITPIGRFLRRTSLDEFPQFVNVLLGHMSIVGPRPPLPDEVSRYEIWQRRRLSMKPGITCLWQVSGRNNVDFRSWMKLDLEYIDNWSWALDLKILFRTIPAMFRGY